MGPLPQFLLLNYEETSQYMDSGRVVRRLSLTFASQIPINQLIATRIHPKFFSNRKKTKRTNMAHFALPDVVPSLRWSLSMDSLEKRAKLLQSV
jgi:hypothetical protein